MFFFSVSESTAAVRSKLKSALLQISFGIRQTKMDNG